MKRFISKYSWKYPRSLVYMLQASEYSVREFWDWFLKVRDFNKVEDRKHLHFTTKAKLLILVSYFSYAGHLVLLLTTLIYKNWLWALAYFILWPYIVLLKVVIANFILRVLQKPVEKKIRKRVHNKLKSHQGLKIGIAGSFGKTTMKEILLKVLGQSKKVKATIDNKNTPLGIAQFVDTLEGDEEVLIFEMGEYYKGDIKELSEMVNPDIGIITGVNEAHLEKFETVENAAKTIFEIADYLDRVPGAKLYVNQESGIANRFADILNFQNLQVQKYGQGGVGEYLASDIGTDVSGTHFILKAQNDSLVVRSKLLGTHQVGPLSLAAVLARSLNMKTEDIELGLKNTIPFAHRLEPREVEGGVIVIDDTYNGNPDGVRVAIDFLQNIKDKRRFFVTPGLVEMGQKSKEVHQTIGKQLAEAGIEKVVLIKNSVTPFIEEGLKADNFQGEIIWYESAREMFKNLPRHTVANDVVLYQNDWPDQYS